jgi:carbamoyl-phosphate synthase large subunit
MEIVHDEAAVQLERYMRRSRGGQHVLGQEPGADRPLSFRRHRGRRRCLSDGTDTFIAGVMEHIEEAGIHSGDSACSLPPHSLSPELIAELERQTGALALALNVVGLMNTQYAIKDGEIYVLEVNPRASRTVPFVAKVIGRPIAKIAARVMAGSRLKAHSARAAELDHIAVKEAVFPFARFPGVDTVLGPEMRSTGEVMGLDRDYAIAFAKSQLGAGVACRSPAPPSSRCAMPTRQAFCRRCGR